MSDRTHTLRATLRLHGEPLCEVDGRIRALEPRAAALLALVAVDGAVPRERAARLLWPDSADARGALRQQLARFRRLAGVDLVAGGDTLRLAPGVTVDPDGAQAPLLGDLRFHDQPDFDAWLQQQRTKAAARTAPPAAAAAGAAAAAATELPATLLRPPRLIGRTAECDALAAAWAAGHAVLLLGEAGLGKSRLLEHLAAGRRVLAAAGRPGDAGVPYATLVRLLRRVRACGDLALTGRQRAELARLLPEMAPGADLPTEAERLVLQHAVEHLLTTVRVDGEPLDGVVVDDLHFADEATLELLPALVGALGARLRFAFAQRPGEGAAATAALRDALEEGGLLTTLALAPLSEADLAALLDSLQIEALDAKRLAAALARRSGGNPLFALETVKQALASGQLRAGELPRPASVATLIERRLQRLSEPALALARVAAVAGPDFGPALAEHALDARAIALADAWLELDRAQVLRDSAFAHDLVADAVLRTVPQAVALPLHRAIADWLQAHEGEPARIAAHLQAAGEAERALPWLHRAAARARQALRPREAADFLQRAFDIELAQGLRATAFDTLTAVLALRLVVDQDGSLLTLVERLERLAETPAQRIAALLERAELRMHRGEHLEDGRAAAERAAQLAEAAGEPMLLLEARVTAAVLQEMTGARDLAAGGVDAVLGEVAAVADTRQRCNLLGKCAYVLARAGRTREGGDLFDEAARQAADHPQVQVVALANAAQARLQLHDPEGALLRLERSDALRRAHDELKGSGHANAWMKVWALQLLGRYAEALALFDVLIEEIGARSPGKLASVYVDRARLWLALGQPARALQDRERARALQSQWGAVGLRLLDLQLAAAGVQRAALDGDLAMPHYYAVVARLLEASLVSGAARDKRIAHALAEAQRCGYRGLEASALARRAAARATAGEAGAAADDARAAVALAAERSTDDLSFPDLALRTAGVLRGAGRDAEARAVLEAGLAWLGRAATDLPLPFQSSLLERNPVHRMLALQARRG